MQDHKPDNAINALGPGPGDAMNIKFSGLALLPATKLESTCERVNRFHITRANGLPLNGGPFWYLENDGRSRPDWNVAAPHKDAGARHALNELSIGPKRRQSIVDWLLRSSSELDNLSKFSLQAFDAATAL